MLRKKKAESPKAKAKPAAKRTVKSAAKPKAKPAAKAKTPAKPKASKTAVPKAARSRSTKSVAPISSKKALSEKKRQLPGFEPPLVAVSTFKPLTRQGETQLVAFVRDPQCIFTYWEITPQRLEEVKKELQSEFQNSHMVLRLYEISSTGERHLIDEIRVEPGQINQYVEIKRAGGVYQFEVAQKTDSGKVVAYVTSKSVTTEIPSVLDNSDPIDPASGGTSAQGMAPGMQAYFEEMGFGDPPQTMTGVSSMESRQRKQKSHWSSFS